MRASSQVNKFIASFRMIITSLFFLFVSLTVPAKFVTKPEKSVTAYKSRDTLIKCDIFGYPTPEVKWKRAGKNLSVDRHVISGNNLMIKNTTEEDEGTFTCWGVQQLDSAKIQTEPELITIDVEDVGKLRILVKRKRLITWQEIC